MVRGRPEEAFNVMGMAYRETTPSRQAETERQNPESFGRPRVIRVWAHYLLTL